MVSQASMDELRRTNEQLVMALLRTQALDDERNACYAQVISRAGEAIVETDKHLIITAWNQAAVNIYGWSVEEAMGQADVMARVGQPAAEAAAAGSEPLEWEEIHRHKGGHTIRVAGTTYPLADAFGHVHGYLSVIHDVKAREERIERNRQRDAERAAELQREIDNLKSAFLLTMTHELRQPLNPILGFTRMLLDKSLGKLSAEQEEVLRVVIASAEQLLTLIDDVLYAARLEAEQIKLHVEDFALEDVILETTAPLIEIAGRKGRQIVVQGTGGTTIVHTDRNRLVHVLSRILRNALNAAQEGDIVVKYEGTVEQVVISVSDSGIGISPEDLGRVFKAFSDSTNLTRGQGVGLGLFTCHKVVELMGGILAAESSPRNGSTFTFTLPRARS